MRVRFYLHVIVWCALFAVFIARGLPIVAPAVRENKIGPIEPDHSTDSYLSGLTHIRGGTEEFGNLIDTLPRNKTVVVFVNADNSPSEFLGMLVAYLSWPLEARIIKVRDATLAQEIIGTNPSIAGLFFCSIQPPASLKGGVDFGSAIIFVPSTALPLNR